MHRNQFEYNRRYSKKNSNQHNAGVVANLSGHDIERYKVHGSITIPNIPSDLNVIFDNNMCIAVEPFIASSSEDIYVKDMRRVEIYQLLNKKPIRDRFASKLLEEIERKFKTFPFSKAQLSLKGFLKERALSYLLHEKCLIAYPVLYHQKYLIAQSELTFFAIDDKIYCGGFTF